MSPPRAAGPGCDPRRPGPPARRRRESRRETGDPARGPHRLIGNTLADRMQHDGWLETLPPGRFPKHDLIDPQPGLLRRRADHPAPLGRLRHARPVADRRPKTDVILAFFGYNESFGQEGSTSSRRTSTLHHAHAGAEVQRQDARGWCSSRRSPTRTCTTATCPTARRTTRGSSSTPTAMAEVARANDVPFVDLFHPTQDALRQGGQAPHDQRHPPDRRRKPLAGRGDRPGPLLGRAAPARPARRWRSSARPCSTRTSLVQPLSHGGRLLDLRRPGRPEVRRRPDQPRGHAARDGGPRRDDRQPRPAIWAVAQGRRPEGRRQQHAAVHPGQDEQARARARTASTSSSTARRPSSR